MKRLFALVAFATVAFSAQAQYQAQGVRFLSQIALNQFPGSPTIGSALYGYTSPSGREYAIIGVRNGESVVDITNPVLPVQIEFINGPNSDWHENVTLGNYCYAVTDSGGAVGIRIIDLNNVDNGSASLVATYNGGTQNPMAAVHTIQADPTTNRLFANGGNNTGVVILDATNPTSLVRLGRWNTKYVHDCYVKNFTSGPYAGKQVIYAFCGSNGLYILDATNPAAITVMGNTPLYGSGSTYCHSGSLSPDAKYMMVNDEFDENGGNTTSCTTILINVENLSAPVRVGEFKSGVTTIDHNSQLRDGHLFLSAYEGGVRIYDAANPLGLFETGYFDTYPGGTANSYNGNWGVFSHYASGNIALSDRQRGLFVLDPSEAIGLGAPIVSLDSIGFQSGGIAEARKSDDRYLVLGPVARTQGTGTFILQTTYSPTVSLDFTLEARGSGTARAYLKNRATGQWDMMVAGILQPGVDRTLTITGVNATNYVSTSGQIETRADIITAPTGSRPLMSIDMLQVKVNRT